MEPQSNHKVQSNKVQPIELVPAIDIIGGRCVRLTRGDYAQKKEYGDPVEQAKEFERLGFRRLHVVDLDGAKAKHVVNADVLKAITGATHLVVDFGGGIKSDEDIALAFNAGAQMVTIGSIAANEPMKFLRWLRTYGADRIILGADARDGKISVNGWQQDSTLELLPFLDTFISQGVRNVLCTDISRDGTLEGPSIGLYSEIMARWPHLHLIASGGVSSIDDIKALSAAGIPSVVFGKAWYEGRIKPDDIQQFIIYNS